jgi:hypothetical protein
LGVRSAFPARYLGGRGGRAGAGEPSCWRPRIRWGPKAAYLGIQSMASRKDRHGIAAIFLNDGQPMTATMRLCGCTCGTSVRVDDARPTTVCPSVRASVARLGVWDGGLRRRILTRGEEHDPSVRPSVRRNVLRGCSEPCIPPRRHTARATVRPAAVRPRAAQGPEVRQYDANHTARQQKSLGHAVCPGLWSRVGYAVTGQ